MFSEALIHSLQQLEHAKQRGLLLDFALIGGLAVAAWGAPRATHDVDFAVAVGSADPHATAASLGGTYEAGDPDDPLLGVIHLSIGSVPESVPVQLVLFPAPLADLVFRNVKPVIWLEHRIPVVSWPALILLKLYAGGPQDRLDAEGVLKAQQPQAADLDKPRALAESAGLLDEWESLLRRAFSR